MARIERFEDLIAWQRARNLAREIYRLTSTRSFEHDRALQSQTRRAALSIMANIAEGFERGGRAEFHQFLSVAKASCAELRSHLYLALDTQMLSQSDFAEIMGNAEEVGRIIGGLRVAVGRQRGASKSSPTTESRKP